MMQHQGALVAARLLDGEDWRSRAACRFTDPELFFPISDSGKGLEQAAEAKAVCSGCEVRRECLAFAIRIRERHGIWGGLTAQERDSAGETDPPEGATASDGVPYAPGADPDRNRVKARQGVPAEVRPWSGYGLIEVQAMAARVACEQITGPALRVMRDSVLRASSLPAGPRWEFKATAHAEIFRLLADAAGVPGSLARETGLVRDLMLTVGPRADGLIINSRQRLLACLHAGDAEGAAIEMEDHLRILHFMARLYGRPAAPPETARKGAC